MRYSLCWWLLAAGCVKPALPAAAPASVPVRIAVVLESFDDPGVAAAPDAVLEQVSDELSRRNLVPTLLAADPSFGEVRSTEGRLERLSGEGPALLVECAPRFSAQVNGRYRWSVQVEATLSGAGAAPLSRSFKVPVHLVYDHQDEPEALAEAAPIVARQVGLLLDEWIEVASER